MYEVEVKARLKNREEITKKLESLGCKFGAELHQIDDIFTPKGDVFPPPKGTPVLRIRKQNGQAILTLKINQTSRQDCIEHEVEIKDADEMDKIIEFLGFEDDVTVEKRRVKAKYNDMEIVLDEVEQLGSFIEVERVVADENADNRLKIQQDLYDFLESIGVGKEDHVIDGKYDIMLYEKLNNK